MSRAGLSWISPKSCALIGIPVPLRVPQPAPFSLRELCCFGIGTEGRWLSQPEVTEETEMLPSKQREESGRGDGAGPGANGAVATPLAQSKPLSPGLAEGRVQLLPLGGNANADPSLHPRAFARSCSQWEPFQALQMWGRKRAAAGRWHIAGEPGPARATACTKALQQKPHH